jgi:hypothetical protein
MSTTCKNGDLTVSFGNHALPESVAIFNQPAALTCRRKCKNCYALRSEALYPSVLQCRMRNLGASYRKDFPEKIIDLLRKANRPFCRPHESGDFYSPLYAEKWEEIAEGVKGTTFYALSKSPDQPRNFHVVQSILPGGEINFAPRNVIIPLAKKYHATICPKTMRKGIRCMIDCHACLTKDHIVFIQH